MRTALRFFYRGQQMFKDQHAKYTVGRLMYVTDEHDDGHFG